jgi:hypothetical protein
MPILADGAPTVPTNLAPLPRLLAYAQSLGLERHLDRASGGIPTLALVLVWLVLAWRGSGRPEHADQLDEPLLTALLGRARLPCARTLRRSLARFSAKGVRAAVEAAYLAELPRRAGRIWVAIDAHQVPYWGRGKLARFLKGWSGTHRRRLRGYRLYVAVDTDTVSIHARKCTGASETAALTFGAGGGAIMRPCSGAAARRAAGVRGHCGRRPVARRPWPRLGGGTPP